MKKYLLILLLTFLLQDKSFSQSLRRCGCQTWREWNSSNQGAENSRRERIRNYEKYKQECIRICREEKNKKRRK
jgi:hypothetical protein